MFTYCVLPFGPANGPFIFITMTLDFNNEWQALAIERGINIVKDNNTQLFIDYLFSSEEQCPNLWGDPGIPM